MDFCLSWITKRSTAGDSMKVGDLVTLAKRTNPTITGIILAEVLNSDSFLNVLKIWTVLWSTNQILDHSEIDLRNIE